MAIVRDGDPICFEVVSPLANDVPGLRTMAFVKSIDLSLVFFLMMV
jgi:hypothetical protein